MKPPIKTKSDELALQEGCKYEPWRAEKVRDFFAKFLKHSKGDWAGKPFKLLDWQYQDIILPLFSWIRPDGTRRHRRLSIWVPKSNGKSAIMSALMAWFLYCENEPCNEVYCIAQDVQQAKIVFDQLANFVSTNKSLDERSWVRHNLNKIELEKDRSFARVLSGNKKGKHGLSPQCLILDEIGSEEFNRQLWESIEYSTDKRRNGLLATISTAGYSRTGVGYELFDYSQRLLKNEIVDTSFLPVVYAADSDDDWRLPATWKKANPCFDSGIPGLSHSDFQTAVTAAINEPRKESNFKTTRLNLWCGSAEQWLSSTAWESCYKPFDLNAIELKDCYLGLDLSRRFDLTAAVYVFPIDDKFYIVPRFFLPEDLVEEKEKTDHATYKQWIEAGYMIATPGDTIDFQIVRQTILNDAKKFNILEIGYDRRFADQLCREQLRDEDGFKSVEVPQGLKGMGPPTMEFERLVLAKRIVHNNNPVFNFCLENCRVGVLRDDLILLDKRGEGKRIDGVIAAILGLQRAMASQGPSIYTQRGVIAL